MTEGLLPCWRCGNKDVQLYTMKSKFYIVCAQCDTVSPLFNSSLQAAKSWNDTYVEHRFAKEAAP